MIWFRCQRTWSFYTQSLLLFILSSRSLDLVLPMFFMISCQPQDLATHRGDGDGGGCTSTKNLMIKIYTSAPIEIHGSCMHIQTHLGMTWFGLKATRTS